MQDLISKQEDELVNAGILQPNRYRAAQESFVEMVFMSLNTRFGKVAEVAKALQTGEPSEPTKADGVMDVLKRLLSR